MSGFGSNPAFQPETINVAVHGAYLKNLGAAQWLEPTPRKIKGDSVSFIDVADIAGTVDFISTEGGFNSLDQSGDKTTKIIKPYGAFFDITKLENDLSDTAAVQRKIGDATHLVRKFADDLTMSRILAASLGTFDGTDWTDTTNGDPLLDLAKSKRIIKVATEGQFEPDSLVINALMEERLGAFDFVRNALYIDKEYATTGNLPSIGGHGINTDDGVDSGDAGVALSLVRGKMGFYAETYPFTVETVSGLMLGNPMIHSRTFIYEMKEPVIDRPELGVKMTGLKA